MAVLTSAPWIDTRPSRRVARAFLVAALALLPACAALASSGAGAGALGVPEGAWGADGLDDGEARVEARLLVDPGDAAGSSVRAGVLFDLDPGWHLYWRNPGESGLPTRLVWQARGARPGPLHWPAPSSFDEADGLFITYGYSDRVLLWSDVELSDDPGGERRIEAEVELLVCRTECIPASFRLARSLDAARVDSPTASAVHAIFAEAETRLPEPPARLGVVLEAQLSRSASRPGDGFEAQIRVLAPGWQPAGGRRAWIADPAPGVELELTELRLSPEGGGEALLRIEGRSDPQAGIGAVPSRLAGLLTLAGPSGELRTVEVDLALTEASAPGERPGEVSLWRAILLALLGGLILNAMPCVLPVLAIKVFAVAEMAHRDRSAVHAQGTAYTLGILASMALLASVVLALRAAGTWVGWGFQLQSPLFVAAVSILLVAFALNLFGVFEITAHAAGSLARVANDATGVRRSFFEGLLAVALATPCSAPFLGTAVGFAFAGSTPVIVAIFLSIGAGLAAPFLLISWVPGWARFVPRAGPWMLKLRAGLGFALLATVVWLLWIVGSSSGTGGMTALIALLVGIAFALWLFGQLQSLGRSPLTMAAGIGVLVLAIAGLEGVRVGIAGDEARRSSQPQTTAAENGAWRPWQADLVTEELSRGRPVFVAFSAGWCITCKLNERVVLADDRVESAFAALGFTTFKADWTRRDERIRQELARFGKAGVPLYLVYDPAIPNEPTVLPELLSIDEVLASLHGVSARLDSEAFAVQTMKEPIQ